MKSREGASALIPLSLPWAGGAAFFVVLFGVFGVPPRDTLLFLLGCVLGVLVPGWALVKVAGIRAGGLETAVLAMALGSASAVLVNKFSRLFGVEPVFFIWLGAALAYCVFRLVKAPPGKVRPSFWISKQGWGILGLAVLCLAVLAIDNYRNARPQPDGSLRVNMHYYDGLIRNATIRETAHSIPPHMPFAAGVPLGYHYGMDLFAALFERYLGLEVPDLVHRFVITFFMIFMALAGYVFIRELASSAKAASLGAFLLIFGSGGLSYLFAFLLGIPLGGNSFRSFYLFDILGINSFLPALGLFLAGAYAASRARKTGGAGWSAGAILLLAAVAEFKVFLIGPIVAALLLTGGAAFLRERDKTLLRIGAGTAFLTGLLLLPAFSSGSAAVPYGFDVGFTDWIKESLKAIPSSSWSSAWRNVFYDGLPSWPGVFLCIAYSGIFLLGSLGLSLAALPALVKRVFSFRRSDDIRLFLSLLFMVCAGSFFFLKLSLGNLPRNILNVYNFYLGLAALTILFADLAARFTAAGGRLRRAAAPVMIALLALPNSALFLRQKTAAPDPRIFNAEFLKASFWIRKNTDSPAVILHPLDEKYVCYFAGRRAVLDGSIHSYLSFHLLGREIKARRADIERFFQDPRMAGDVLDRYHVSLVWAPAGHPALGVLPAEGSGLACFTRLPGKKTARYEKTHDLVHVYRNDAFVLWEVRRAVPSVKKASFAPGADS